MGILEFLELVSAIASGIKTVTTHPYVVILAGLILYAKLWKALNEFKRDFEETKAQDKRWNILSFARGCRNGERHTREEWKHVISEIKEYETYTEKKKIENGVIEEDAKYLRDLYYERNRENDFL